MKQEKLAKVAKVIGLSKLKSKFESHEAKRNLCAQYDLFLADDRVIPLLPKLIGGLHLLRMKQARGGSIYGEVAL